MTAAPQRAAREGESRCGGRPYCLNLKDRDDFIVRKGLWAEFVGQLPMTAASGEREERAVAEARRILAAVLECFADVPHSDKDAPVREARAWLAAVEEPRA